jgi:hypothetical protein
LPLLPYPFRFRLFTTIHSISPAHKGCFLIPLAGLALSNVGFAIGSPEGGLRFGERLDVHKPGSSGLHWYPTQNQLAHSRRRMEGRVSMHGRLCSMFLQQSRGMLCTGSSDPLPYPPAVLYPCSHFGPPPTPLDQSLIKQASIPLSFQHRHFLSAQLPQRTIIAVDLPAHRFSARSSGRDIPYHTEAYQITVIALPTKSVCSYQRPRKVLAKNPRLVVLTAILPAPLWLP